MAQVTLSYTSVEVFHHVAERLRVYRFFENRNKNIKTNKERGEVYNDFDFDSTVLLSECTSNITDALVPHISIDHAVLEADKNNASVFYNIFAFDHPDYDISSSTPDKEYLKKCTDLQLEGIRLSVVVKNCLIFIKCDKGIIVRVPIARMMLGFYQTIRQKNGFLTRSL